MVKNVPKNKNVYLMNFCVFYMILSDLLRQTVKKITLAIECRMADGGGWSQDGENALTGAASTN